MKLNIWEDYFLVLVLNVNWLHNNVHNILLQPSYPTTEPAPDEGHDVHYSGGGINLLLEINYAIMNTI